MTSSFIIEPLGPSHDRTEFTCGVDALDRYFREQAGQDVRRRATACFVAREIATKRIAGFYTLTASVFFCRPSFVHPELHLFRVAFACLLGRPLQRPVHRPQDLPHMTGMVMDAGHALHH